MFGVTRTLVSRRLRKVGIPPRKRRCQNIDIAEVIELYESGMSCQEIAPRFNTSDTTIRRRLKAAGITLRQGPSYRTSNSMEQRLATAFTNCVAPTHIGPNETHFASFLDDLNVRYRQQTIIGHYNVDFTLQELPVVIEVVSGGGNARTRATKFERYEFILNSGWHIFEMRFNGGTSHDTLTREGVEHMISCAKALGSTPPAFGKYRVFRGDGHLVALRGANRDRWASIGAL
ncbi:helix-turn-helix domain-containing protein [Corynebacterium sp. HMSC065A05]|uniref:helix-turn-helix domain-containing protein n=1 Tax=Corynebacterium sp. HMSC065A05 TaxID=1739502 RepID=UPI00352A0A32